MFSKVSSDSPSRTRPLLDSYNILLILKLESLPLDLKYFMYKEVQIKLQGS